MRKLLLWYLQEILIQTRSLRKFRLPSKQLLHIVPGSFRVSSLPRIFWILIEWPSIVRSEVKVSFLLTTNVLGWEHYRLRMQDTADYLPSPPSLWSATGATQKTTQLPFLLRQKSWWDRQQSNISSHHRFLGGVTTGTFPEENMTKIIQEELGQDHGQSIPFTEAWLCTSKFLRSQHRRQLGLAGYQYTRGWGLQSSKKEGSPFRMVSRTDRTGTAKQQVLWPEIPTNKESPSHLRS